jgi:hypothetical protein
MLAPVPPLIENGDPLNEVLIPVIVITLPTLPFTTVVGLLDIELSLKIANSENPVV